MTDRDLDLIEAAGKAAGLKLQLALGFTEGDREFFTPEGKPWNPLTDDGDALRLAVALRLQIEWPRTLVAGDENCAVAPRGNGHHGDMEPIGADPAATLRRLIVRAAAALSRAPGAE